MAIKNRQRAIVKNIKYNSGQTEIIDLPQDNLVRRINLNIKAKLVSGAAKGAGVKNGGWHNLIKRIQVRLNGVDSIFDVDLRTYYQALVYEYGTKPYFSHSSITIPNNNQTGTELTAVIPIDFALIRHQISDYSALIPAHLLDSFELLITWATPSDLLTTTNNTTVDATTKVEISIIEVYENSGDRADIDNILANLTKIYEGVEQTLITKQFASYPADELPVEVRPVPARHLSALIVGKYNVTDNNPSDSSTAISQIKLENVKGGGEAIFYDYFGNLSRSQKLDYRLESDNDVSAVYLDWLDLRNGGLANVDTDALKYKFLTATVPANKQNAIRIYKKYIPITAG